MELTVYATIFCSISSFGTKFFSCELQFLLIPKIAQNDHEALKLFHPATRHFVCNFLGVHFVTWIWRNKQGVSLRTLLWNARFLMCICFFGYHYGWTLKLLLLFFSWYLVPHFYEKRRSNRIDQQLAKYKASLDKCVQCVINLKHL